MRRRWGSTAAVRGMAIAVGWNPPKDFQGWINHVFNRPVAKPEWFWQTTAEASWEPSGEDFISYFTRTLENPRETLQPFSDAQINQGLNQLISPSCSNAIHALKDDKIPWLSGSAQ